MNIENTFGQKWWKCSRGIDTQAVTKKVVKKTSLNAPILCDLGGMAWDLGVQDFEILISESFTKVIYLYRYE